MVPQHGVRAVPSERSAPLRRPPPRLGRPPPRLGRPPPRLGRAPPRPGRAPVPAQPARLSRSSPPVAVLSLAPAPPSLPAATGEAAERVCLQRERRASG